METITIRVKTPKYEKLKYPTPPPPPSPPQPAPWKTKLPEVSFFAPLNFSSLSFFLLRKISRPLFRECIFIILFIVCAVQRIRDSPQTPLPAAFPGARGRRWRPAGALPWAARVPLDRSLRSSAPISRFVLLFLMLLVFSGVRLDCCHCY